MKREDRYTKAVVIIIYNDGNTDKYKFTDVELEFKMVSMTDSKGLEGMPFVMTGCCLSDTPEERIERLNGK